MLPLIILVSLVLPIQPCELFHSILKVLLVLYRKICCFLYSSLLLRGRRGCVVRGGRVVVLKPASGSSKRIQNNSVSAILIFGCACVFSFFFFSGLGHLTLALHISESSSLKFLRWCPGASFSTSTPPTSFPSFSSVLFSSVVLCSISAFLMALNGQLCTPDVVVASFRNLSQTLTHDKTVQSPPRLGGLGASNINVSITSFTNQDGQANCHQQDEKHLRRLPFSSTRLCSFLSSLEKAQDVVHLRNKVVGHWQEAGLYVEERQSWEQGKG